MTFLQRKAGRLKLLTGIPRRPTMLYILPWELPGHRQRRSIDRYIRARGKAVSANLQARALGHAVECVSKVIVGRGPYSCAAGFGVVIVECFVRAEGLGELEVTCGAGC